MMPFFDSEIERTDIQMTPDGVLFVRKSLLDKAEYELAELKTEIARLREALTNIANLGLQVLPVDKRWGTAFSIAHEALKGGE